MQWGLPGPRVVLVHQALQGCRDLRDHQVKMPNGSILCALPSDRCVRIRGREPHLELGHQPVWILAVISPLVSFLSALCGNSYGGMTTLQEQQSFTRSSHRRQSERQGHGLRVTGQGRNEDYQVGPGQGQLLVQSLETVFQEAV